MLGSIAEVRKGRALFDGLRRSLVLDQKERASTRYFEDVGMTGQLRDQVSRLVEKISILEKRSREDGLSAQLALQVSEIRDKVLAIEQRNISTQYQHQHQHQGASSTSNPAVFKELNILKAKIDDLACRKQPRDLQMAPTVVHDVPSPSYSPVKQNVYPEAKQRELLSKVDLLSKKEQVTKKALENAMNQVKDTRATLAQVISENKKLENKVESMHREHTGAKHKADLLLKRMQEAIEKSRTEAEKAKEEETRVKARLDQTHRQILSLKHEFLSKDDTDYTVTAAPTVCTGTNPSQLEELLQTLRQARQDVVNAEAKVRESEIEVRSLCTKLESTLRLKEETKRHLPQKKDYQKKIEGLETLKQEIFSELESRKNMLHSLRLNIEAKRASTSDTSTLERELRLRKQAVQKCHGLNMHLQAKYSELEETLSSHGRDWQGKLSSLEASLLETKAKSQQATDALQSKEGRYQTLVQNIAKEKGLIQNMLDDVKFIESKTMDTTNKTISVKSSSQEIENFCLLRQNDLNLQRKEYEIAQESVEAVMKSQDEVTNQLTRAIAEIHAKTLQCKSDDNAVSKLVDEVKKTERLVERLKAEVDNANSELRRKRNQRPAGVNSDVIESKERKNHELSLEIEKVQASQRMMVKRLESLEKGSSEVLFELAQVQKQVEIQDEELAGLQTEVDTVEELHRRMVCLSKTAMKERKSLTQALDKEDAMKATVRKIEDQLVHAQATVDRLCQVLE